MCRSWKWNNFILDTGPHIFHTPDNKMWNFWNKNFGNLLTKGKYWAKNTYDDNFDKFYDYPLSVEALKYFPKNLKSKILLELKSLKILKKHLQKILMNILNHRLEKH